MDEHDPVQSAATAVHPEPAPTADGATAVVTGDDLVIDLRDTPAVPLAGALPAWPMPAADAGPVLDVAPGDVVEVRTDDQPAALVPAAVAPRVPVPAAEPTVRSWVHEPEPRWRTTQLVAAVVAAAVVGLVAGLITASSGGGGDAGSRRTATPIAIVPTSLATGGAAGAAPSTSVDVRRTGADARATAATGPGSYAQPFPVGARATLADPARGDLDVVVIGVDDDPWPELRAANPFNAPPPANLRSLMVTVAVIYRAGSEQRTFDGVSGALVFSAFGSAGREHRDAEYPVVAPMPLDRSADLLDGGSVYGNLVFAVEADSRAVTLRVQRTGCAATCGEVWFTLR